MFAGPVTGDTDGAGSLVTESSLHSRGFVTGDQLAQTETSVQEALTLAQGNQATLQQHALELSAKLGPASLAACVPTSQLNSLASSEDFSSLHTSLQGALTQQGVLQSSLTALINQKASQSDLEQLQSGLADKLPADQLTTALLPYRSAALTDQVTSLSNQVAQSFALQSTVDQLQVDLAGKLGALELPTALTHYQTVSRWWTPPRRSCAPRGTSS